MKSATARLIDAAQRGALHHSLILHGPSLDALRSAALAVARARNCESGTGTDECNSCQRIDRGSHPDVRVIGVEEDRKLISVEQIRGIVSDATFRPYEGRSKVFIVEQADAMSPGGANALLKTLEEPGSTTSFLLLTRSPELLLPTIRSRSQMLPIRDEVRGNAREVASRSSVPMQIARLVTEYPALQPKDARAFVGSVYDALRAWGETRDASALLQLASRIGGLEPASDMLAALAATLRDVATIREEESVDVESLRAIRQHVNVDALLRAANHAVRGSARLQVNVDPRLVVEQALAEIARG